MLQSKNKEYPGSLLQFHSHRAKLKYAFYELECLTWIVNKLPFSPADFECNVSAMDGAEMTSEPTISAFVIHWIALFGIPSTVTIYRGSHLESSSFSLTTSPFRVKPSPSILHPKFESFLHCTPAQFFYGTNGQISFRHPLAISILQFKPIVFRIICDNSRQLHLASKMAISMSPTVLNPRLCRH